MEKGKLSSEMLTFADSIWHVLSATIVFFMGLLLVLFQVRVFQISLKRAFFFYIWHTIFCLFYMKYSLAVSADASVYYLKSINYDGGFNVGTKSIFCLTSLFTNTLGMSYGGVFLIYNLLGFVGMLSVASALQRVLLNSKHMAKQTALLLLLTPGLSLWSSAIGKDSLSFMAVGLVCWAILQMKCRRPALVIGCMILLMVRPHVLCVVLGSVVLAVIFASHVNLSRKIVVLAATMPLAVAGAILTAQYVGLDNASGLQDVQDFIELRQTQNLGGATSIDIASMSIPLRMFSYLYRPVLFERSGLFGFMLGAENLLLLAMSVYAIWAKFVGRRSQLEYFSIYFFVICSLSLWIMFANTTANLGIAIRQKWMFLPMIFLIIFSLTDQKVSNQRLGNQVTGS